MNPQTSQLFRPEAIAHRKQTELAGVISNPMVSWALPLFSTLCCLVVIAFALLVDIARKEVVTGYLIPADGWSRAVAPREGIVTAFTVTAGDFVYKGDVIAHLGDALGTRTGSTLVDEQVRAINEQIEELSARLNRVTEEYRVKKLELEDASHHNRISIDMVQGELQILEELLDSKRLRLENSQVLQAQGGVSSNQVSLLQEEVNRESISVQSSLRALANLELNNRRYASNQESLKFEEERELFRLEQQIRTLSLQLIEIGTQGEANILAPRTGIVALVRGNEGDAVRKGELVATIAPKDPHNIAKLLVPSNAIGFLEPGQSVRLMYDAFPHDQYGTFAAEVVDISGTPLEPSDLPRGVPINESVFSVEAKLETQHVIANGETRQLIPGMLLTADIIVSQETLIDWFFRPLRAASGRI